MTLQAGRSPLSASQTPFQQRGFSLIEVIAAVAITAAIAVATFQSLAGRSDHAKQLACEATRAALQVQVDQFRLTYQRDPTNQLTELASVNLWTGAIPRCGSSDEIYTLRTSRVSCPVHGD